MRNLKIIIAICIVFYSCNKNNPTKYYYIRYYDEYGKFKIDTVDVELQNHSIKNNDSLFFKQELIFNGMIHELRKYSNAHKSSTDGDYTFYELDNMGIIFSTDMSWNSYKRLYTNNDSINKIIDFALLNIISTNEYEIKNYIDKTSERVVEFDSGGVSD